MKPKTKKEIFLEKFDKVGYNAICVYIQMPDLPATEKIINPKENFAGKKAYYEKAYNDNLELKSFPDIKIVDYSFYE